MRQPIVLDTFLIDEIYLPPTRMRALNRAVVEQLKKSIAQIGLKTPLSMRWTNEDKGDGEGGYALVTGAHRLQAAIELGLKVVPVRLERGTEIDAKLWEIAENLHRAELTVVERSEHIAEWIRLTDERDSEVSAQVEPKLRAKGVGQGVGGGRPESGINAAARELGIERTEAQRAIKIDSLSPEAKDKARELHLDGNQTVLMNAVRQAAPADQLKVIEAHFLQRNAPPAPQPQPLARDPLNDYETVEKQVDSLMAAWNGAGPEARERFLATIDKPVADRTAIFTS